MMDFKNLSGPQIERKKKNKSKVFQDCGLSIIATTNIISVGFLDVTFNLKTELYQPLNQTMNLNTLTSTLTIPHKS